MAMLIAQTTIGTDSTLCTGDIDASPPAGLRRCLSQVSACRTNEGIVEADMLHQLMYVSGGHRVVCDDLTGFACVA
jgi:hypothetical protein